MCLIVGSFRLFSQVNLLVFSLSKLFIGPCTVYVKRLVRCVLGLNLVLIRWVRRFNVITLVFYLIRSKELFSTNSNYFISLSFCWIMLLLLIAIALKPGLAGIYYTRVSIMLCGMVLWGYTICTAQWGCGWCYMHPYLCYSIT